MSGQCWSPCIISFQLDEMLNKLRMKVNPLFYLYIKDEAVFMLYLGAVSNACINQVIISSFGQWFSTFLNTIATPSTRHEPHSVSSRNIHHDTGGMRFCLWPWWLTPLHTMLRSICFYIVHQILTFAIVHRENVNLTQGLGSPLVTGIIKNWAFYPPWLHLCTCLTAKTLFIT